MSATWNRIVSIGVPIALVVVLSGLLARAWSRARVAEAEVARQREAADLVRQKFTVAVQDAEAARKHAADVLAADDALRAEYERLKKSAGGVRVVSIREGSTKPKVATGEPVTVAAGAQRCDPCLVPPGALLMASVKSLDATTDKGNLVALQRVIVERITPLPRTVLLDDMITAEGSFIVAPQEPKRARFSLGGGAWWRNPGWTAEARGGLRVTGPLWVEAAARFDNQYGLGVRWEIQ